MADALIKTIIDAVPIQTFIDIGSAMILTMTMIIVDVLLRLLIEATRYNKDMGKSGSIASIAFTMLWRGWGVVKHNSKNKRYMMSKRFSNGLAKKILLQYPGFFVFAAIVYIYPDYEIMDVRIDKAISVFLLSLPILCESMSIIENLNEIDSSSINAINKLLMIISKIRGN